MKTTQITDSEDHITSAAVVNSAAKLIAAGSILVVTRSGILSHTLPVAITTVPVTVNQDLKALTPKQGVMPAYIAWALRCFARDILNTCSKQGTTVNSIETAALQRFEIPLAPLDQQKRIVAEIEKQFSRLDEAVANLNRVKANLKRYKAAVLKAAVEGRLVETEAELARREGHTYETGEELLQRILGAQSSQREDECKNKMPAAPDTADLPALPAAWARAALRDVVQIIDYRGRTPPFSETGIPHLRSSNVRNGMVVWTDLVYVSDEIFDAYITRGLPQEGDVLFTTEAPLGEVAMAPTAKFSLAQRMMLLRPLQGCFDARFLMFELMSPPFQAQLGKRGTGSTVTGVSSRNFQPLPLAVPPIAEQQRIVAEIERCFSLCDNLEGATLTALERATQLRGTLLQAAFSADGGSIDAI
jgi:type I restriction enzyme S subunit